MAFFAYSLFSYKAPHQSQISSTVTRTQINLWLFFLLALRPISAWLHIWKKYV